MKGTKLDYVDVDDKGTIVQIVWSCGCAWDKEMGQVTCGVHR